MVLESEDVFGASARALEERVLNATSHDEMIDSLQNFLRERLALTAQNDGLVLHACRLIQHSSGAYSIDDLVRSIGLSERHLERRFKTEVGVSPKLLSRIARFQRFLSLAQAGRVTTLTDIAISCGYYDQAHLARDVRSFSGASPSELLAGRHRLAAFFTNPA